jgi:hypothetical protein
MRSQFLFFKLISIVVMTLGLTTIASADNTSNDSTTAQLESLSTKKNVQLLFTQTAPSATISPDKEKNWYILTLNNVNPDVLWFSNRPVRMSGNINVAEFIKYWKDPTDQQNFVKDHPNADLIGTSGNTKVRGVFMLTKPNYDPQQQTLSYRVYHISGAGNFNKNVTSLQHVALFIDTAALFN